jgi:branched-chain amino acid transport system permease protein
VPQLVSGVAAIVLTIALHLLLTRTTVGSQLLAVAEDRSAAMLMGIRPDRMQALAWGLAAASAGIAGSLMAMSYPWSPSVGESFGLTAFVVVTLGGFGSVPGALYAGLIIGLLQALSAYWLGPIYKDIVVYALFVALLWLRPQGLMGKA